MPIVRLEKNKHMGKRCFIVATGPGVNKVDLSLLDNEITIGMNVILRKEGFIPDYLCIADTNQLEWHYDEVYNDKMKNGHYVIMNGCNMRGTDKHIELGGMCIEGKGSTCSSRFDIPDQYKVHTVRHEEKSGAYQMFFNRIGGSRDNIEMTRLDEYYIDPDLHTISGYGCSTMDALAIPLAVYLGFNEIYMLGTDGGRSHFYDNRSGKRHIEFGHVLERLEPMGINLYNTDPANAFPEVEYREYNSLF
jgi:hypothetical protein